MPDIFLQKLIQVPPKQLLSGEFDGLSVMEPYSDDPVILTTRKRHGVVVVCMIGRFLLISLMFLTEFYNLLDHYTGKIFRQIPVSCLPTDIAMRSKISKLAVDSQGKELYINDVGCMFVVKLGLLDNSCSQFG